MICVYGQSGVGSFSRVSRGIKQAAEELRVISSFQLLDAVSVLERERVDDAPVAVICGDPSYVSLITGHKLRYLVLAPNSNGIPDPVKIFLSERDVLGQRRVNGFLAPSSWAAEILRREFPEHDIIVSPHGVSGEFRYGPNSGMRESLKGEYAAGRFFVIHVTSTLTDRKGTPQLIDAWRKLSWRGAKLLIYCHPLYLEHHHNMVQGLEGVAVMPTMGMSDAEMYLNYSAAHVICQPSRAEGFGLVPLEAMCSGVPVVATSGTGHSQYMSDEGGTSYSKVFTGPDGPIDDYVGATAPTVTADQIADALQYARTHWENFSEDAIQIAPDLANRWTWRAQNEPALRQLVEKASVPPGPAVSGTVLEDT